MNAEAALPQPAKTTPGDFGVHEIERLTKRPVLSCAGRGGRVGGAARAAATPVANVGNPAAVPVQATMVGALSSQAGRSAALPAPLCGGVLGAGVPAVVIVGARRRAVGAGEPTRSA